MESNLLLEQYSWYKKQQLAKAPFECLLNADIEPNPHQVNAFCAAIQALKTGGIILADEVGLGKTIEAGLVLNYVLDNGAKKVLISLPATLRKQWEVDDCVKFVEREIRRGNHYDGIIMDPPSYGRGPKGEIWKIEEKIYPFIELCTKILSDDPLFFLVNSYTTGLQPAVLTYMLETQVAAKFGGKVVSDEIGLPVSSNGLVLPCGASGRWEK